MTPPNMVTTRGPYLSTKPCLDRDKPGLREHKQRKGQLDCSPAPVVLRVDRIDEQRPAVLKIRDHGHADDAHRELQPTEIRTVSNRRRGLLRSDWHCFLLRHAFEDELSFAASHSGIQYTRFASDYFPLV